MKKILSLLFFVLAFSAQVSAQTAEEKKELTIQANAKQNLHELIQVVDLSGNEPLFNGLYMLFVSKHASLSKEGITEEEKREISFQVTQKLIASFSDEQMNKIKQVPGLLLKLSN